jgi:peptidoglycan/LPS O-acetylase OafA/YrhL
MDYRREIDGLRALAVISVILFHAGFETFSGGFVGVDVFFVISGYLITSIVLEELKQGTFSIVTFYERRARRIIPALFFVMMVCIPFAWRWLLPRDMKDFSESLVAVSAFASNVFFGRESGYFDTAAEFKPLLHTWSLAVEEQYYLVFPLFLSLFWSFGTRWLLFVLGMVFVVSLAVAQWASLVAGGAAFFLLPTRAWELLIGAFAAFYLSKAHPKEFDKRWRDVCGWFGVSLILYGVFAYNRATPFPGLYALLPTVGTVLIILFATNGTTVGACIGHRALVGVGLISYSTYLWHQPLFAFARHQRPTEPSTLLFVLLTALTLVLGYLSWRYVEAPFRNKRSCSRRMVFLVALVGTCLFIGIGYQGVKTNGYEYRFEKILTGDIGHHEFHQHVDRTYVDCEPNSVADKALRWEGYVRCKQTRQGIPDIVLLGDSHAEHLFIGLAEHVPNKNVAFYIHGEKPYLDNPEFKTIFAELLSNRQPQSVVLTMNFNRRIGADGAGLFEGFSSTIKALLAAGKTVSLASDIPQFKYDPGYCVYAIPSKPASPCALSIDQVGRQKDSYESILKRLSAEHGVPYVSLDSPLCTEHGCSMIDKGAILYRDDNHLNIIGSRLVGKYLAEKLRS